MRRPVTSTDRKELTPGARGKIPLKVGPSGIPLTELATVKGKVPEISWPSSRTASSTMKPSTLEGAPDSPTQYKKWNNQAYIQAIVA